MDTTGALSAGAFHVLGALLGPLHGDRNSNLAYVVLKLLPSLSGVHKLQSAVTGGAASQRGISYVRDRAKQFILKQVNR